MVLVALVPYAVATSAAAALGSYFLFMAMSQILSAVTCLGLPYYVLRKIPVLEQEGAYSAGKRLVVVASVVSALCACVVLVPVVYLADHIPNGVFGAVVPVNAGVMLPAAAASLSVLRILAEALKARGYGGSGVASEFAIVPWLMNAVLVILIIGEVHIDVKEIMLLYVVSLVVALAISWLLLWHSWPTGGGEPEERVVGKACIRLWLALLIQTSFLNVPLLAVPYFADVATAGVFGLSLRLAAVVGLAQQAVSSLYAPEFARQFAAGEWRALQQLFRKSQFGVMVVTAPFLVAGCLSADAVLGVFAVGGGPADGDILRVIFVGRLCQAVFGLVTYYLWMTNAEGSEVAVTLAALVLVSGLVVWLGPGLGGFGIAIAQACGEAVRYGAQFVVVSAMLSKLARESRACGPKAG